MQINSGLYQLLSSGFIYNTFQRLVGSRQQTLWFAKNVWKCSGKEKILDIGCGTCGILDYLPKDVDYCGIDICENYISLAKKRYGNRGRFQVSDAKGFGQKENGVTYDLILCNGLLHHINDEEALTVIELAKSLMHEKSRFICIDNCYLIHQSYLSKWITGKDRGKNIRQESEFKILFNQVFSNYTTNIATDLLRIPYVTIIIECTI